MVSDPHGWGSNGQGFPCMEFPHGRGDPYDFGPNSWRSPWLEFPMVGHPHGQGSQWSEAPIVGVSLWLEFPLVKGVPMVRGLHSHGFL